MRTIIKNKIAGLYELIGNTPLLEISFKYKGELRKLFVKAEYLNYTGSIKDRMALHIMKKAYERNEINVGDTIVEATSGNTGIAFSAVGACLGHPVKIYMPDWMSEERKLLIKSYGAEIVCVTREQNGFLGSIDMTRKLKEERNDIFLPRQFENPDNSDAHYQTTGPEMYLQMQRIGKKINAVVAGVGTGGTVMGICRYLKEQDSDIKVHPLEPSNSPTMSTGYKVGKHRIQGISDDFIPDIVNLDALDHIIDVDDGDSIIMAQKLSKVLGLGVGISSGANFLGALKVQNRYGHQCNVATIFCDDNKKYLSTDLLKEETVKDHFLSPDIELIGVISHKRAY